MTDLHKLTDRYVLTQGLARSTAYLMHRAVTLYGDYLDRPAGIQDLEADQVSRFLALLETTHAKRTVAGHRVSLLTLWRFAADMNLASPPGRVRRVRRPDPLPIAWTHEEIVAVVRACGEQPGELPTGDPLNLYLTTLAKCAYETGLRRMDLWSLGRSQIRPDGSIQLLQQKTGRQHCPRIMPDTVVGIRAISGTHPLKWPYRSTSHFYKIWKRVVADAGVRPGALQQIRRTGATLLAIDHPESVQRYLGHRTESMQRHYVDLSIADPVPNLPPPI